MFDLYGMIIKALRALLGPMTVWPLTTITVILLCLLIEALSILVGHKAVDRAKLARYQQEVAKWDAEYLRALKRADKKAIDKLMRRKPYIEKLRYEIMRENFKVFAIMFVPVIALWSIFKDVVGTSKVAFFPLLNIWLDFNTWYIIAIFSMSFIFQRFLKPAQRGKRRKT